MHVSRRLLSEGAANAPRGQIVFDLLMLILLGVAFAGAVGYVWVCNDLTGPGNPAGDKSP